MTNITTLRGLFETFVAFFGCRFWFHAARRTGWLRGRESHHDVTASVWVVTLSYHMAGDMADRWVFLSDPP
jgi:hypothetical protein